jgi:PAS domain S-box-containing protein
VEKSQDISQLLKSEISNSFPFGVISISLDKTILDVNDFVIKATGKLRKDIVGKKCNCIFHVNDNYISPKDCPLDKMIKSNIFETTTKELQVFNSYFLVTCCPILDENNKLTKVVHIATDITKLKEAENDLSENRNKHNLLIDNIPGLVYRCKLDTNWTMLFMSKASKELTGYDSEDFLDNNTIKYADIIHPEDRQKVWDNINNSIPTGDAFVFDYRIITKTGEIKFVWEKGKVLKTEIAEYIEGVILDITDRKQFENELLKSEEKYRLLIENQNDLFIKVNKNINCTYVSQTFCNLFGKKEEELLNKSFMSFVHEDDWIATTEAIDSLAHFPHTCYHEHRAMTANGWRWLAWSDKAIVDENQQIIEIIGVGRDITDRKVIEFELIRAKEKAEESDKLKSAFLANMSHEIRTPMNGLIGFSELISQPNLIDEERLRYAEIINSSCNQLLKIVNDLIDISHIETNQITIKKENLNLTLIIKDLLKFYSPAANNKGLDLIIDSNQDDLFEIVSDATKIRQVLTNLLSNAIKFTKKGYVKIGYEIIEKSIYFYVSDTGKGIRETDYEMIFDRFSQVENDNFEYGGTGLGLSIAKAYVELLGGELKVKSVIGKGSTFYFTIPYVNNELLDLNQQTSFQKTISLIGYKVLVAEDERINFQLLKTILMKLGAEVLHAKSGIEAVEIVKSSKSSIDLVLMDIKMPDLNGTEALIEIKKINNSIPIFACTAYAQQEEADKFFALGFTDYLAKPINRQDLIKMIEKHLEISKK